MRRKLAVGALLTVVVPSAAAAAWWHSLDLASQPLPGPDMLPGQLDLMQNSVEERRGTILAIVTSTPLAGGGSVNAGLELTELARAYYVFRANGYDVEIASPKGGRPPVNIDEDLGEADIAFLNDPEAQRLLADTRRLDAVDSDAYAAVYVVGGKGVMFDLAEPGPAQRIIAEIYDRDGVVGAVCHGPVALLATRLANGRPLLAGKSVTGFSNEEESFIIPNAREVFPLLLEDGLRRAPGRYSKGPMYLDHTITDGRLVTGQNPWSTWSVAESMIRALGHTPVERAPTREENAVHLLEIYERHGLDRARGAAPKMGEADKRLLLIHAMIAAMRGDIGEAFSLQRLAH